MELRALLRSVAPSAWLPRARRRLQHCGARRSMDFAAADAHASPVWLSGGRIRWRTVQTVLDAGYVDAYQAETRERARPHVAHLRPAHPAGLRLRAAAVCRSRGRLRRGPPSRGRQRASDHFPVVADFLPWEESSEPSGTLGNPVRCAHETHLPRARVRRGRCLPARRPNAGTSGHRDLPRAVRRGREEDDADRHRHD